MARSAIAAETADVLRVDPDVYRARVAEDAEVIKAELDAGTFDNPQGAIGLEYEFYAVATGESAARWGATDQRVDGALMRVPRRLLSLLGFEKELGLHNLEMNTTPQPMSPEGVGAQAAEVEARLSAALDHLAAEDLRLVSDAIWTIPPPGETARGYLTDSIDDGGIRIAANMSNSARYHAMANSDVPAGMRIEAPHVSLDAATVMPESLITSIQPHYQIPVAVDLPAYFAYALRIAGPLLGLGVNSPFFPPDLYDADASPRAILDDAWMEHRIRVFETALNTDEIRKVRFPADLDTTTAAVERIIDDATFVPMPVERGTRFDDEFAHFRRKHGTYWRWVRPVFDGESRESAHVRIEFRPIPSQPTIRDSIAFQAAFAGLIEHMHATDHPVSELDWETANDNFYAAMRHGLAADFSWITADGTRTTDTGALYADLLDTAAEGLGAHRFSDAAVGRWLDPLRARVRNEMTPARWKLEAVRARVADGASLEAAIYEMQRAYIQNQAETVFDGSFADWLPD